MQSHPPLPPNPPPKPEPPPQQQRRRMIIKMQEQPLLPLLAKPPPQPQPHCVADKSLMINASISYSWYKIFNRATCVTKKIIFMLEFVFVYSKTY